MAKVELCDRSSERVKRMIANFMELHNKGYSIPQIAAYHHVSFSTVYKNLELIAKQNGMNRQDLLELVRTKTSERVHEDEERKIRLDIQELKNSFQDVEIAIERACQKIDEIVTKENYHDEV